MRFAHDYYRALVSGQARGFWPLAERSGLWAASIVYGWGVGLRHRLYDWGWKQSYRPAAAVISVGNLTLGGTGKTPCVEYVARYYQERQRRVAILSRGYGPNPASTPLLPGGGWGGGGPGLGAQNDEALVLAENLPDVPHLQGADRAALAKLAIDRWQSEVLILDDGFQHRRLARDLDLVLLDATEPWGHGHLFPRGLLRETPDRLGRADLILLTRCDQVTAAELRSIREQAARHSRAPVIETTHRPLEWINSDRQTASLELTARQPVAGFCGIGNPEAFRRTLESLGSRPVDFRAFADHQAYTAVEMAELEEWGARQPADCIIATTQKDLVKLRRRELAGRPLWALRIGLHVENGLDVLERRLNEVITANSDWRGSPSSPID